jgi:hypothetical protein
MTLAPQDRCDTLLLDGGDGRLTLIGASVGGGKRALGVAHLTALCVPNDRSGRCGDEPTPTRAPDGGAYSRSHNPLWPLRAVWTIWIALICLRRLLIDATRAYEARLDGCD